MGLASPIEGFAVIIPNPKLGPDEVTLGYTCLANLLQQVIINILHKSYNMTYEEAYKTLFYESMTGVNPRIKNIIDGIIRDSGRGIAILGPVCSWPRGYAMATSH